MPLPAMLVAMVMAPGRPACAGLSAMWLRLAKAGADAFNSICSHHICLSQQGWDDICMQAERARKGVTYTLPALCKACPQPRLAPRGTAGASICIILLALGDYSRKQQGGRGCT